MPSLADFIEAEAVQFQAHLHTFSRTKQTYIQHEWVEAGYQLRHPNSVKSQSHDEELA